MSVYLLIDDSPIDYDLASTMSQDTPFPGGQSYVLTIDVDRSLFDFLTGGEIYRKPPEEFASKVLGRLTRLLRGSADRACEYYLNTIDELSVSKDFRLVIKGTCSRAI